MTGKRKRANLFARFLFVYVNKYIINIFPVVTNMTKMEYDNSQKGQYFVQYFTKYPWFLSWESL
ncbi:restriction endonuclease [Bacillus anthracis]|nr:restriction endonuclease [Bacillus anthracis]PHA15111.1 restriction endonuclease [Bacillus sp. AFS051223]PET29897.1 restriction endonuclease [Bacillus anthracis]PFA49780.1 restriction endonuclease [Bacillus anthracis]PFB02219.1 restriction endonuclease [Bacillus anthracis]